MDAAKRQLETFIRLFFHNGDPIAMHTLAAAAFGIIRDLNAKRGGRPTLHEMLLDRVKPEYRQLIRRKLSEAQNFFKHANRDHKKIIDFNPEVTELIAMDACFKYAELTGEMPPLFQVFHGWLIVSRKELFTFPEERLRELDGVANTFLPAGRTAFFNDMLPVVMRSGV